jgi:hypothetical protein
MRAGEEGGSGSSSSRSSKGGLAAARLAEIGGRAEAALCFADKGLPGLIALLESLLPPLVAARACRFDAPVLAHMQ